jgi:hypothetical protein
MKRTENGRLTRCPLITHEDAEKRKSNGVRFLGHYQICLKTFDIMEEILRLIHYQNVKKNSCPI